jgi:GAF domain
VTNLIIDSILHDFYSGRELFDFSERALHETGGTGAAIALQRGDAFVCCASSGDTAPGLGALVDANSGLTGACIRETAAVISHDTGSDPRADAALCEQLGIASLIAVPIVQSGKTIGVIEAFAAEVQAFGPEQLASLEALAREIKAEHFPCEWNPLARKTDDVAEREEDPSVSASVLSNHSNNNDSQPPVQATELPVLTFTGDLVSTTPDMRKRIRLAVLAPFFACLVIGATFIAYSHFDQNRDVTAVPSMDAVPSSTVTRAPALPERQPQSHSSSVETPVANNLDAIERAARAGDAESQMKLAEILALGKGIGKDVVTACAWYTLANMAGYANSSQQLASLSQSLSDAQIGRVRIQVGQMFASGIGVNRDLTAAYTWFILAGVAGAKQAPASEQALAQEMKPAQIATAKQRANTWLVQHRLAPLTD